MKWHPTGFAGSTWTGSFERMIATTDVVANGSFLSFYVRFPGDKRPRAFMLRRDELEDAIGAPHGTNTPMRIQSDAPWAKARKEQDEAAA